MPSDADPSGGADQISPLGAAEARRCGPTLVLVALHTVEAVVGV